MGLIGTTRAVKAGPYLVGVAVLQFAMCFLPLMFESFADYFMAFLGLLGGIFVPMWTLVVVDYFIVRRCQVTDKDLFMRGQAIDVSVSRFDHWHKSGWIAALVGLGTFYLFHYGLTDIGAQITAVMPAVVATATVYLVLTLGMGMDAHTRKPAAAQQ